MYYPMYFDPTYLLVIIGVILSMAASAKVKSTFARYSRVRSLSGMTGAQAAERILHQAGIYDVGIARVSGDLTDHYDPSSKTLRLSDSVYNATSVAAVSVAAHECGHAIQDQNNYAPLRIRAALVPVTNFGATISWPLILLGILLGGSRLLITIGIWLFIIVVAFHFVTLPVEFNASSRALKIMETSGILHGDENRYAKAVLGAAALTYVASAAAMILQLLRLLILTRGYRRNDR
jgi:hypothetical protein